MKDRKIKAIMVHSNLLFAVGKDGITKILDDTIEYPDSIHPAYEVYVGDKVITRIENCPVVVEYE